jgi:hypothetical protein
MVRRQEKNGFNIGGFNLLVWYNKYGSSLEYCIRIISTMKIKRATIYLLLVCILIIAAAKPVHAAVQHLATQSGTTGTVTQSPTGPSSTPPQTFTPTMTPSKTPTTTLIPLPAITLIFPASTITPTATTPSTPQPAFGTVQAEKNSGLNGLPPRFRLLAVLIVILWFILIGFSILFIRQFR